MDDAQISGDLDRVLFTREQISERIAEVAAEIDADYVGKELLLVGVLNGAVMVMADLSRALTSHCRMDWMAISSYGSGTQSSGVVRILKDLNTDISGLHVLVVEDIIVERVAPTSATVLIEGQTGTGKELIARLVHERSGRRGPFVPVNCGAIPPELMETELFGHAKGAFTGAHQQRDGLFVSSRGGTLFLDEISEMRSDLQVKLLRALEESRVRPVGADREIPIDVRIVASAQPGLREQVQQRRFREDLYYRLNVVHILLPGLHERPEDIAPLVQHFMQRVADEFGMTPVALDDTQLADLRTRNWPGNVRELRNFVERTVLMGVPPGDEGDVITTAREQAMGAYPIEWTLEQVKQAHIERVLGHNGGNRSATARQLGVSRKTLERRLGPSDEHDDA